MNSGIRKARYYLSAYRKPAIYLCTAVVLLSLIGAVVTFTAPPSTAVTDVNEKETIRASLTTEATVQNDSELYSEGETLQNKPLYFYDTTPTATLITTTDGPASTEITGTKTLSLVYEIETKDGEPLWTAEESLANTALNGNTTETRTTLDMAAVQNRYSTLKSDTNGEATVLVKLVLTVDYQSDAYGDRITATQPISISTTSYSISPVSDSNTHLETEQNTRPIPTQISRVSLPFLGSVVIPHRTIWLLILASIAGGIGVVAVRLEEVDPAAERDAIHQIRYNEWISEGAMPASHDYTVVTVNSLEGLVNTAIDLDKRVLHDENDGCYAVFDFATMYVYAESDQPQDKHMGDDYSKDTQPGEEENELPQNRSEDQVQQPIDQDPQHKDAQRAGTSAHQSGEQGQQLNEHHPEAGETPQADDHEREESDSLDDFVWES